MNIENLPHISENKFISFNMNCNNFSSIDNRKLYYDIMSYDYVVVLKNVYISKLLYNDYKIEYIGNSYEDDWYTITKDDIVNFILTVNKDYKLYRTK